MIIIIINIIVNNTTFQHAPCDARSLEAVTKSVDLGVEWGEGNKPSIALWATMSSQARW